MSKLKVHTLPVATTEDLVIMPRAAFDAIVRAMEAKGIEVDIVAASPELQAAFDEALQQ